MVTPMTRADLDAFQHTLIRQRITTLIADDLTGRSLETARQMLAYTIIGHRRFFPDCPAAALLPSWPAPDPLERVG